MLREEMAKYSELSGNDGEHTPICVIGAYLDGYDKGRKTMLHDVKTEIDKAYEDITMYSCDEELSRFASKVCEILVRIGKTERVEI